MLAVSVVHTRNKPLPGLGDISTRVDVLSIRVIPDMLLLRADIWTETNSLF